VDSSVGISLAYGLRSTISKIAAALGIHTIIRTGWLEPARKRWASRGSMTGIALVGCGYVADYYMGTLPNHPQLELAGVYDRDGARSKRFCQHYDVPQIDSLDDLLSDSRVNLVVNLTNPDSHYEISKACLEAGKHVYSEKPLAMQMDRAEELVELAESRELYLASAPCNFLSETAQTVWKALRDDSVGPVRVVYAEMDDGLVHRRTYRDWISESGSPWPAIDEFEVGCTVEHAGYYLTWLTAFFGPATSVTSFASCQIPDKLTDVPLDPPATPDFSVACVQFENDVVARLTCSIIAPHDRSLRIIGDDGILSIKDCWDYGSPVYKSSRTPLALRAEKYPLAAKLLGLGGRKVSLVRKANFAYSGKGADPMDFARGVAELADAIREGRPCRMAARHALHVNELTMAIARPDENGVPHRVRTSFEPIEPMPWAGP